MQQFKFEKTPSNRRQAFRYCTDDVVLVEIGPDKVIPASVRDVSRSGLNLELQTPIPEGNQVKIMFPGDAVILGEVRHVSRQDDRFHAGILIHDMKVPPAPDRAPQEEAEPEAHDELAR